MDNLQKAIVVFFALTVLLSVGSLLMFFVEVPYKSTLKCVDNTTVSGENTLGNNMIMKDGKMQDCVWTDSKQPSVIFDALVNLNIASGIIFVILSAYAYYNKRKYVNRPKDETPIGK